MLHALKLCVALSTEIGSYGVVTNPLDDGVREFYASFGFEDLPFDPQRAMIVTMTNLCENGGSN